MSYLNQLSTLLNFLYQKFTPREIDNFEQLTSLLMAGFWGNFSV